MRLSVTVTATAVAPASNAEPSLGAAGQLVSSAVRAAAGEVPPGSRIRPGLLPPSRRRPARNTAPAYAPKLNPSTADRPVQAQQSSVCESSSVLVDRGAK